MTTSQDVQRAVEKLAADLGIAILVEDSAFQPLWWSAQDSVDGHRRRSIMQRSIHPSALAMVKRLKLSTAAGPVRTPAVPDAELLPRWCVPLRGTAADRALSRRAGRASAALGYLWVLDPAATVSEHDLAPVSACAALASAYLADNADRTDLDGRRRGELLQLLANGPDDAACQELIGLQRMDPLAQVVVCAPAQASGWQLPADLSVHVAQAGSVVSIPQDGASSGAPLPLGELHVASYRAQMTLRAIRAGARLTVPDWDHLGAWLLVITAPATLTPQAIHHGAQRLMELSKPDLLNTARITLELGGDVAQAAAVLYIHRTTLYYRLDRITELTGVDVRTSLDRFDLQLALRLAAWRAVSPAAISPIVQSFPQ